MESAEQKRIDASLLWEMFDIHARIGILLRSKYDGFKGYELAVLLLLCSSGVPPSIGEIAEALGVTSQYASSVLAGLVEGGYAAISGESDDKRRKVVYLTERGRDVCCDRFRSIRDNGDLFSVRRSEASFQAVRTVRDQIVKAAEAFGAERERRRRSSG